MKARIKKIIKENWKLILIFLLFFVTMFYCVLQTMVVNDDLPYSLFYRGTERVKTISQILRNQYSDYLTINGRFIVHCVVQFVLIFNKALFAIMNPLLLIITFIFTYKTIKYFKIAINVKKEIVFLIIISLFLLLFQFKYLIYWVAGSVNYVWVYAILSIFIYYYLVYGLKKYRKINMIIFFILSTLHESLFVYLILLIFLDFIYELVINKCKIKTLVPYFFYFIFSIIGGLILLKAPGNALRMNTSNYWYEMSLIKRLSISIPVVSMNLFKLFNIKNILPTIFIIVLILTNFNKKIKFALLLNVFIIILSLLSVIFSNGWLYFVLAIVIFINLILISIMLSLNKFCILTICYYAVPFSMILTPEFSGQRPNYYFYFYIIICIILFLQINYEKLFNKKFFKVLTFILFLFTIIIEINIYYNIGVVKKIRQDEINNVVENNLSVFKCKKISNKYAEYQADSNAVCDDNYWASKYFKVYYNLSDNIKIKMVD